MKITGLETTPIFLPTIKPYRWSLGVKSGSVLILVTVTTDEGIVGFGECIGSPSAEALCDYFEKAKPFCLGQSPFDINRIIFFSIGAGLFGLLTFLRYRFSWWPIHPIGLTISAADNNKSLVMPVFIVWVAKSILLRLGGVNLYQKAKPLFMGLMTGYTVGIVWSFAVDALWFSGQGHLVHWW